MIIFALWWGTEGWEPETRQQLIWAQIFFLFGFTKVVKLVGLFRRNPGDIAYLPVSIVFGWFHGFIKLYALVTLNMTSWGSRPDGDTNDDQRLARQPQRSDSITTPRPRPDDLDRLLALRMRTPAINASEKEVLIEFDRDSAPVPRCTGLH